MIRAETPFFHDPETIDLIGSLSDCTELTIYPGAGATIDRVGLDWYALTTALLRNFVNSEKLLRRLLRRLGPRQAASVAAQLFLDQHGKSTYRARLNDELRRIIYWNPDWLGGRLTGQISQLLVARLKRGASVAVATTNYEDYLLNDLTELTEYSEVLGLSVKPSHELIEPQRGELPVYFLHGRLPQTTAVTHDPVVSEADYMEHEDKARSILMELFRKTSVLIIGASMNDPPLLRALLESKDAAEHAELRRFAIMPLQGKEWQAPNWAARERLMELASRRFRHLGVAPIFPHYFFQVPQFIHEVVVADAVSAASYCAPDSTLRYGQRLSTWWRTWWREANEGPSLSKQGALVDLQARHCEYLRTIVKSLRSVLEASKTEVVKLEVWLRWRPDIGSRYLRLWASSVGAWKDMSTMRDGEIDDESQYAAIRIFCDGRPQRVLAPKSQGRWRVYLGSPIHYVDEALQAEVPVGVIVFATMQELDRSCLNDLSRANWATALEIMQRMSQQVIYPDRLSSA